eukprot:CAMPEP_0178456470 /NCGR_PEP_ID=MMETSP0689_2-20121128/46489_1 /TAXON_ID=160604 /ORGANISM="Amphidinium massartii, Strain CS-259" /LENGTH=39 /DNA_ID= /DNA_START= /DNA_END= /DNA_ORIENTATION=
MAAPSNESSEGAPDHRVATVEEERAALASQQGHLEEDHR